MSPEAAGPRDRTDQVGFVDDEDSLSRSRTSGESVPAYAPDARAPFAPLKTDAPAPRRVLSERAAPTMDWRSWVAATVGAVIALAAFAGLLAWALALR